MNTFDHFFLDQGILTIIVAVPVSSIRPEQKEDTSDITVADHYVFKVGKK